MIKMVRKKSETLIVIVLLSLATVAPLFVGKTAKADLSAYLTGNVYDYGVDTDSDGKYNYLIVKVEANVTVDGDYSFHVSGLRSEDDELLSYYVYNVTYLEAGIQNITVTFNGITIHAREINITKLYYVELYDVVGNLLSMHSEMDLTETYNYTLFDVGATFTDTVDDASVDADSNGFYDYLEIKIGINVEDEGLYAVYFYGLANASYNYVSVNNYIQDYLTPGIHYLEFSVYGPTIYSSHVTNISTITWLYIDFFDEEKNQWIWGVDTRDSLPLNHAYDYFEFEFHARLTGNIFDEGVDADGNGLYDYLKVGVEFEVSEAGYYRIQIFKLTENDADELMVNQYITDNFDVGTHIVYFEFYGPMFAYNHFSPANISDFQLYEPYTGTTLDYVYSAALSHAYDYTLFEAPLKDVQLLFTVYPDGTTGLEGKVNYTNVYPQSTSPLVNASIGFSTVGTTTTGSAYGRVVFPDMPYGGFSTASAIFKSKLEGGLLNATLDFAISPPPSEDVGYPFNASNFNLEALYANGLLNVYLNGETKIPSYEDMLILNITDLIIRADYKENAFKGNITFRLLPGVPTLDLIVNFNGNKTDLCIADHVNVTYGVYPMIGEINATSLDNLIAEISSNFLGPTGWVANMTAGTLEGTQLDIEKTEWTDHNGALVQFNATIHGNFTLFFAKLLTEMFFEGASEVEPFIYAALDSAFSSVEDASIILTYYHSSGTATIDLNMICNVFTLWNTAIEKVPETLPPEYNELTLALLNIANATAHAITDFQMTAAYSSEDNRLTLHAQLLADQNQLENDVIPLLPNAFLLFEMPTEIKEIFEAYLSVKYCDLTYAETSITYENGKADFEATWTCEGDFKAQANHAKNFYISYLAAMDGGSIPSYLLTLNETLIDLNNFSAQIEMGSNWEYFQFDGVVLQPPKDTVDTVRFQFNRFFNATNYYINPPGEFQKIKVTITGAFNGTHTIILNAPNTVPNPDAISSDFKTMTWENVSLASLGDLEFDIAYQEIVNYHGSHNVIIFTNSTMSEFNFDANTQSISFTVSGDTGTGFCQIAIPRTLLYANLTDWTVKLDGATLSQSAYNVTENSGYVFIKLNYTHSSHTIQVIGTWVVSELQPNIIPLILAIIGLIAAAIVIKQRKRVDAAKVKCQSLIKAFANRMHTFKP